jgi:hypothetical protein
LVDAGPPTAELERLTRVDAILRWCRLSLRVRRDESPTLAALPPQDEDQCLRRVDPVWLGAACGDQAEEDADAAADVEHVVVRLERDARRVTASKNKYVGATTRVRVTTVR